MYFSNLENIHKYSYTFASCSLKKCYEKKIQNRFLEKGFSDRFEVFGKVVGHLRFSDFLRKTTNRKHEISRKFHGA